MSADVWGPVSIPSIGGNIFFIAFIDYFSNMKFAIPFSTLKDADMLVIDFLNKVATQCGHPVAYFHHDQ